MVIDVHVISPTDCSHEKKEHSNEICQHLGYDEVAILFLNDGIDYSSELENDGQTVEQRNPGGVSIV